MSRVLCCFQACSRSPWCANSPNKPEHDGSSLLNKPVKTPKAISLARSIASLQLYQPIPIFAPL